MGLEKRPVSLTTWKCFIHIFIEDTVQDYVDDEEIYLLEDWGKENFEPISDPKAIPAWIRRSKIGTSLHVIGFRVTKDWHFRMAASLITNFFSAIYKNEMKFSLNNGEIVINSQTLLDLFNIWILNRKYN